MAENYSLTLSVWVGKLNLLGISNQRYNLRFINYFSVNFWITGYKFAVFWVYLKINDAYIICQTFRSTFFRVKIIIGLHFKWTLSFLKLVIIQVIQLIFNQLVFKWSVFNNATFTDDDSANMNKKY